MVEVTIQDQTFSRLQRNAKPLVDSIDSVINRALEALEQLSGTVVPLSEPNPTKERQADPRALPRLTHTKVLDASIDGKVIDKANWNLLLEDMLRRGMKYAGTFEKLKKICPVNMVPVKKMDEGYRYLPDLKLSFQGQDSNAACRALVTAAQSLGVALDIAFMWRPKEGAAYPGERARLQIAGTASQASSLR